MVEELTRAEAGLAKYWMGAAEQGDEADEAFGGMGSADGHAASCPRRPDRTRAPLRSLSPVFGELSWGATQTTSGLTCRIPMPHGTRCDSPRRSGPALSVSHGVVYRPCRVAEERYRGQSCRGPYRRGGSARSA